MERYRVRIVGGSLGGLFAAALLSKDGHDVKLYERSVHGLAGRGAGLVGQSEIFAILRDIGCEHVGHVGVVAYERIALDRAGQIIFRQATPQMQISWDRLYETFHALIPDKGYSLGREVVSVGQNHESAYLCFADGMRELADLVIGADGLASVVRAAVNTGPSPNSYAGYIAWRGLFAEHLLPAKAANVLLDRFAFFEMQQSHILGYLVTGPHGEATTGNRRYNWVWYRQLPVSDLGRSLTDMQGRSHAFSLSPGDVPEPARRTLVQDAEQLLPPAFAAAVSAELQPFVQAIFDFETPRMANGRLALLGDAAFVVRPHTAMGVAKAAGDAIALRRLLSSSSLVAALQSYDIERSKVGTTIAAYGRRLGATLG